MERMRKGGHSDPELRSNGGMPPYLGLRKLIYTIGQIEELTGVKSHVLRYWEEVVPGFSPQKDLTGRRTYSQHDLELIYRIKFLINEKKFTAEGAGRQILEEAQIVQENIELIKNIRETREILTKVYFEIKKLR